jgi:peroxiredoxin Q/BCP
MMAKLKPGDKAPDFELKDQDGNTKRLSDFKGRKLLLYFYPRANTPGCTKQACSVRDSLASMRDSGMVAVGISPDPPGRQKKFDDKYDLGFPLLCDEDRTVADAYGVWDKKSMLGKTFMGIVRSSFLIDEQGIIVKCWYKVKPADTVPLAQQEAG